MYLVKIIKIMIWTTWVWTKTAQERKPFERSRDILTRLCQCVRCVIFRCQGDSRDKILHTEATGILWFMLGLSRGQWQAWLCWLTCRDSWRAGCADWLAGAVGELAVLVDMAARETKPTRLTWAPIYGCISGLITWTVLHCESRSQRADLFRKPN